MHLSFEEMSKNALNGQSCRNRFSKRSRLTFITTTSRAILPVFDPETVAFFPQDKIDSALQKVRNASSQLLVLNGEVWKRIVEPVYKIHPPGIFSSDPAYVDITYIPYDIDKTSPTLLYNLNEWDEVLEYCHRKYRTADIDERVRADVFMPECFTVDKNNGCCHELPKKTQSMDTETKLPMRISKQCLHGRNSVTLTTMSAAKLTKRRSQRSSTSPSNKLRHI